MTLILASARTQSTHKSVMVLSAHVTTFCGYVRELLWPVAGRVSIHLHSCSTITPVQSITPAVKAHQSGLVDQAYVAMASRSVIIIIVVRFTGVSPLL